MKKSLQQVTPNNLQSYIKQHIGQLDKLEIPAKANVAIFKERFPVIIFSPGAVDNSLEYSNLLINLASHGYIVVVINDMFLTTVTLPNGAIVPINEKLTSTSQFALSYKMKFLDMQFVYKELKQLNQHSKLNLFAAMNIDQVGVLGHSAGASAAVAMARNYPSEVKAAAALDAPNQTDPSTNINLKKAGIKFPSYFNIFSSFSIPMLQMHSSYAQEFLGAPNSEFKLGKNNYLVTIIKGNGDDYFKHMDFSDYPLFKNVPFIQHVDRELQKQGQNNPIFPNWGYGYISGTEALNTVSTYLLSYFNTFLKGANSNSYLPGCKPLTNNTKVQCSIILNSAVK